MVRPDRNRFEPEIVQVPSDTVSFQSWMETGNVDRIEGGSIHPSWRVRCGGLATNEAWKEGSMETWVRVDPWRWRKDAKRGGRESADGDVALEKVRQTTARRVLVESGWSIGRLRYPHEDLPYVKEIVLERPAGVCLKTIHGRPDGENEAEPPYPRLGHAFHPYPVRLVVSTAHTTPRTTILSCATASRSPSSVPTTHLVGDPILHRTASVGVPSDRNRTSNPIDPVSKAKRPERSVFEREIPSQANESTRIRSDSQDGADVDVCAAMDTNGRFAMLGAAWTCLMVGADAVCDYCYLQNEIHKPFSTPTEFPAQDKYCTQYQDASCCTAEIARK